MPSALEFEGVRIRLGEQEVLQGIDLTVPAGETVALVGPSGCGKSTLLRASIGLVPLSAGVIRVAGQDITRCDLRSVRHSVGYVIQDGGLFPHLTVRGNVSLLAKHLGWPLERISRRIDELAALTRLQASLYDRLPAELSGGQRQRVGLMRALVLSPPLLLLDEPLGALDPMVRTSLQEELREIVRAVGCAVVLVTHDLAEAAFFADRIVVLEAGTVAAIGSLSELLQAPRETFVGRFVRAQRSLHLEAT